MYVGADCPRRCNVSLDRANQVASSSSRSALGEARQLLPQSWVWQSSSDLRLAQMLGHRIAFLSTTLQIARATWPTGVATRRRSLCFALRVVPQCGKAKFTSAAMVSAPARSAPAHHCRVSSSLEEDADGLVTDRNKASLPGRRDATVLLDPRRIRAASFDAGP